MRWKPSHGAGEMDDESLWSGVQNADLSPCMATGLPGAIPWLTGALYDLGKVASLCLALPQWSNLMQVRVRVWHKIYYLSCSSNSYLNFYK